MDDLDRWLMTERENCKMAIQSFTNTEGAICIPEGAQFSLQERHDSSDCLELDVQFFKEWIEYRESFCGLLPEKASNCYKRMTDDIIRKRLATGFDL